MSTRVLVVDDTAIFRRIVSDALAGVPGVEVMGSVANGKLALARLALQQLDLITLDLEMPEMNGIELLEALAAAKPKVGVIVLSSQTVRGSKTTLRALELGAFDFITKPEGGPQEEGRAVLRRQLQSIIRAFERRRESRSVQSVANLQGIAGMSTAGTAMAPASSLPLGLDRIVAKRPLKTASPLVLIGVSTGGPTALSEVLPALPQNLGAPVFVVQHMPPLFTKALAERLQSKSAMRVKEAEQGEIAAPDCAYIAPGGRQMKIVSGLNGDIVIQLSDDPPEQNCRPSVDYLFRSVAQNFPGRAIAVILTGMGSDGTEGLRMLKETGCFSIAQDEASCVVFGMPKEAIQAGVIDQVMPLEKIAASIARGVAGARA